MNTLSPSSSATWLKAIYDHIAPNFYRAEPRSRAWTYLLALVDSSTNSRGSRRHLATYPGERRADGAQRLLTNAQWNEEQVKRDLLGFVKSRFGPSGGMLYVAEMVFPKKGTQAAGVARQFSVESARNENCQIGIVLFYETAGGARLLIDHDLYVPPSWIESRDRCRQAALPEGLGYRSKSEIAGDLVRRVLAAGLVPRWTLVSVLCTDKVTVQKSLRREGVQHLMALTPGEFDTLVRTRPSEAGTAPHRACGPRVPHGQGIDEEARHTYQRNAGQLRSVLVRKRLTAADSLNAGFDVSYLEENVAGRFRRHYYAYSERGVGDRQLAEMVSKLRELTGCSSQARDEAGIDRYEVRSWRGWYRHMTLAMIAQIATELSKEDQRGRKVS